jgi:hypothetical protein
MADVTISGLDAAVPPAGAVVPFSDGTTTNKVNINSIVGLTTNGAYRGTVQRGSYGSVSVAGSTSTYAGIDFTDASVTFMARTSDQYSGMFKTNSAWIWAFDGSGNLVTGTVPWTNVTGKPTTGKVLQMQSTTKSNTWYNATSTSQWTDIPGMSVSITTTGTNNQVLIQANISGSTAQYQSGLRLVRNGATYLGVGAATGSRTAATCGGLFNLNTEAVVTSNILFADTPGAIGTYTYKVQIICPQTGPVAINTSISNSDSSYTMVTTSVITATEIAA